MSPNREPLPPRRPDPGRSRALRPVRPAHRGASSRPAANANPERRPPRAAPERTPLPTDPSTLPPLPDVVNDILRDGLPRLGVALGDAELGTLDGFVRLLLAWTEAINLTAIREPEAVARDHLLDSLAAAPLLRDRAVTTVLDLGSGGGLPGLPLAIALPDVRMLLVESIGK